MHSSPFSSEDQSNEEGNQLGKITYEQDSFIDPEKKYQLINTNIENDLFFEKDIKDITSHINNKPLM